DGIGNGHGFQAPKNSVNGAYGPNDHNGDPQPLVLVDPQDLGEPKEAFYPYGPRIKDYGQKCDNKGENKNERDQGADETIKTVLQELGDRGEAHFEVFGHKEYRRHDQGQGRGHLPSDNNESIDIGIAVHADQVFRGDV